jgi:ketosteroid isomerase-like protein
MSVREPHDWPTVFEKNLDAGDLEQIVSLYEPGAVFVSPSGETLVGRDQIRQVLAGLIEKKARFESHVVRAVTLRTSPCCTRTFRVP